MSFARTDASAVREEAGQSAARPSWLRFGWLSMRRPRYWIGNLIKRFLPRGLFGRSVLIVGTPLILLQMISAFIFYDRPIDTVTWRLAQGVAGDVAMVTETARQYDNPLEREEVFETARRTMLMRIIFVPDEVLPENAPPKTRDSLHRKLRRALQDRLAHPFIIDWSERDMAWVLIQLRDGLLRVGVSQKRLYSSTTNIFIVWMVGSSLVLFAIALIFMRNQVRPIRRLAAAAEQFGKGRDVEGFKPEGATEVRQAGRAFDVMRQRIKRQIRQRTEMLAGVSHDLRTPLTRMKLQLAMFAHAPEADALKSDVGEMEKMVEGYLAFARGDSAEEIAATDLSALAGDVVNDARLLGTTIDLDADASVVLPLRPQAFRRCLLNLIENAVRFAQRVWITVRDEGEWVEVTVEDDGPGIPAERRSDVFRPFYRIEGSRNPETGGVGLGLAIARDTVRSHGGDILLANAPQGGLRVVIRVPH